MNNYPYPKYKHILQDHKIYIVSGELDEAIKCGETVLKMPEIEFAKWYGDYWMDPDGRRLEWVVRFTGPLDESPPDVSSVMEQF
jgi:hypothetical protein